MNLEAFPVDHIGIAVNSIDSALPFYQGIFGLAVEHREILADQNIEVAFIQLPNILIELIAPTDPQSVVATFIQKRGQGLHHICYRVPDIQQMLAHCRSTGLQLIDEKPKKGAKGKLIAFLHPKSCSGTLVEFCQY